MIEPLTSRAIDILRLLASGLSNHEIATQLVIAEGTVKNHVTNILGKLNVRDRRQAALRARELNLIQLGCSQSGRGDATRRPYEQHRDR